MTQEILNKDPYNNKKIETYSFGVLKICFADTVLGKMADIPTN